MYVLEYKQTWDERFKSDQVAQVQALIEAHGAEVVSIDGGTAFGPDTDLPCEQAWGIKTTHANALTIQRHLAQVLDRVVRREFVREGSNG